MMLGFELDSERADETQSARVAASVLSAKCILVGLPNFLVRQALFNAFVYRHLVCLCSEARILHDSRELRLHLTQDRRVFGIVDEVMPFFWVKLDVVEFRFVSVG